MKLAAVGSNCVDFYQNVEGGKAYPGGGPVNMAVYTVPPLTTIHQDRLQLGKTGFYALSCLMNQVSISTILLHPDLIVRGSTGPRKMEENL